jgi:hypothetical protein
VVTTSSTDKYKNYNTAVSGPESGDSYTIVNNSEYKTVDNKKVKTEKPVEQWAIGRYQHYYKHQEDKIIAALKEQGVDTASLNKKEIAKAYSNSPKAQEAVQAQLNDINFKIAEKQIEKHGLKAPVEEVAFLNHFLGNGGANRYLGYLKKYGQEKADQIMAYGNDPEDPNFKGIGGPNSSKPNTLVSDHIVSFRKGNTTTTDNKIASNEPKVVAAETEKLFDDVVSSYTGVQEGNLNGIDELQYTPMGWGANRGVKKKGQNWPGHGDHIHISFTDPQIAIAIIKKAEEIGLNADENLYSKGKVTKGAHSVNSHHYKQFEGEYDGKQLSKGLDINKNGTKLTAKEADAKMKQLYKWIHQTYSI